jgi:hypothetical protein
MPLPSPSLPPPPPPPMAGDKIAGATIYTLHASFLII